MRHTHTEAEGEAGSMPGAQRGTRSRDSRIAHWVKGRRQPAELPRDPLNSQILWGSTKTHFLVQCLILPVAATFQTTHRSPIGNKAEEH